VRDSWETQGREGGPENERRRREGRFRVVMGAADPRSSPFPMMGPLAQYVALTRRHSILQVLVSINPPPHFRPKP
jgi:hypothetical protein